MTNYDIIMVACCCDEEFAFLSVFRMNGQEEIESLNANGEESTGRRTERAKEVEAKTCCQADLPCRSFRSISLL